MCWISVRALVFPKYLNFFVFLFNIATLPSLLMSEDVTVQESDSDLEIDPGTLSPPPPGSPIRMQESPTVQELLSTMGI